MAREKAHAAVEAAIGKLATAMRLHVEAYLRFGDLFAVDPEEAINNLDHAFEAKLEAFHTLYDVSGSLFPYQAHADTAFLIALRNAIHHRDHPLFRTLQARVHLDDGLERWRGAAFLIGRHPARRGTPVALSHLLRLDDIDARLDPALKSPHGDVFKPKKAAERFDLINTGLSLPDLRREAAREGYPAGQVYLDVMPVFVSGVGRVFTALKAAGVAFTGFDAETYEDQFTSRIDIDLGRLEFETRRVPVWAAAPAR